LEYDIIVLADSRYLLPKEGDAYTEEVLLEDALVIKALEALGLVVGRVAWDDPNFDWSSTRFALFRAVWDYFDRYAEFSVWYEKAATLTTFINRKALIDWNIDKHYMADLNSRGVHIPKTLFVEAGEQINLLEAFQKAKALLGFDGGEFVLKPCIAGGARHTYKFHEDDWSQYNPIFQQLIADEAMMLQELQHNIISQGELSLMFMGGEYTHAILKKAKPGDFRVQSDYGGSIALHEASTAEIDFSQKVIDACPEMPLYARVDIFRDNGNAIALAELEIFEPELWFRCHEESAARLAQAIKNHIDA